MARHFSSLGFRVSLRDRDILESAEFVPTLNKAAGMRIRDIESIVLQHEMDEELGFDEGKPAAEAKIVTVKLPKWAKGLAVGNMTVLANLAEIPGISIPCGTIKDGKDEVPVGLQILAQKGEDGKMLDVAKEFEMS